MFSIQQLALKIDDVGSNRLDLEAFEDWFLGESWGYYSPSGGALSQAIAAVHHTLHAFQAGEIASENAARELSEAVRPFVPKFEWQDAGVRIVLPLYSTGTLPPLGHRAPWAHQETGEASSFPSGLLWTEQRA